MEEASKSLTTVFEQFTKFREEMEAIEEKIEEAVLSIRRSFPPLGTPRPKRAKHSGLLPPHEPPLVRDHEDEDEDSELADISFFAAPPTSLSPSSGGGIRPS